MAEEFSIHFWGVRGSRPSPGPQFVRTGGNTSCVEMRVGGHSLIFDAGTGIINLGYHLLENAGEHKRPIIILLSHYHHDHIQGLPHFPPLYREGQPVYITAPWNIYQDRVWDLLMHASAQASLGDRPEMRARRHTLLIEGGERLFWDSGHLVPLRITNDSQAKPEGDQIEIATYRSHAHPRGGSMCYRVKYGDKSAVFATDTESYVGSDQGLIEFARDADLIIHDAHYTPDEYSNPKASRQGWGHSTWPMAVQMARLANIPQVALFHHDPDHDDALMDEVEAAAKADYPGAFVTREGQAVVL
ncbi:MAG TPA: MBL fold metallo-hydrolase [Herpetosiphonaceae bacterium]